MSERIDTLRLVTSALREALRHVPEERRTHKRFIEVDEAAGSTYELDDAEWWTEAQEILADAEKVLAVPPPPVEAPPQTAGDEIAVPEVNAHTLTLKFHRFLSQDEWRVVVESARLVPHIVELEANTVQETPEELIRERVTVQSPPVEDRPQWQARVDLVSLGAPEMGENGPTGIADAMQWAARRIRQLLDQRPSAQPVEDTRSLTHAAQTISDVLEEYADERDCDSCPDCGKLSMCRFHSVLSLLTGETWTTRAIQRDNARRKAAAPAADLIALRDTRDEMRHELFIVGNHPALGVDHVMIERWLARLDTLITRLSTKETTK